MVVRRKRPAAAKWVRIPCAASERWAISATVADPGDGRARRMSKFEIIETPLDGLRVIKPRVFEDERGFFMESYTQADLATHGVDQVFVQDNHSLSRATGVLRGLHYQHAPFAQDKLVRVVRGRIWDVAVDIRRGSPTFRQWFGLELSATNRLQLLVPIGFAHGFVTLEPDTEVIYKVTSTYAADCDAGIRWDDPEIAVDWPLPNAPVLSAKDAALPALADATVFE